MTSILKTLRRGRFGKRSEKLGADEDEQQSFVFEEIETGLETIERRLAAKADKKQPKASPAGPRFPSHLERVEEIIEPAIPPDLQGERSVAVREAVPCPIGVRGAAKESAGRRRHAGRQRLESGESHPAPCRPPVAA